MNYGLCYNCQVHTGFYQSAYVLLPLVKQRLSALFAARPNSLLALAGHSLGGALAQLAAFDLDKNYKKVNAVYTYGSPRVGNVYFWYYYSTRIYNYRVVNYADIVAHVPSRSNGFYHTSI